MLEARLAALSKAGGLYGRRLELVVERASAADPDPAAALSRLLDEHEIFALAAPIIAGADADFARLAAARETPVLGPFALHPQSGFPVNRQVFYLYAGLADQGRALMEFAAAVAAETAAEIPRTAIVHEDGEEIVAAAEAVASQAAKLGLAAPERRVLGPNDPDAAVAELMTAGVDHVFLLAAADAGEAFLTAAGRAGWAPRVLASGAQLGRAAFAVPESFAGRLFLAFPTLPGDVGPRGREAYRRLAESRALPEAHRTTQYSALASVELLIEGLERAGREVSREKLIRALEGLYDHETGLTPPLTFGPNRRVGARGAYVVEVERENGGIRPVSGWIELR